MKIDCTIQILEFAVNGFTIEEKSYDPKNENGTGTKITPEIVSAADYKDHLINVYIDTVYYKQTKVCEIKTLSKFLLQFPMPYRIHNHFSTDLLLSIFSQLFLYSNGQQQGVFKERTTGTLFENCIIPTRFSDSLYITTKAILSTL